MRQEGDGWDYIHSQARGESIEVPEAENPVPEEKRKNFAMIPKTLRHIKGITATDVALLVAIALYADSATHECFASRATLMEAAHIRSPNAFAESLKRLEKAHILNIMRRGRNKETGVYYTNVYIVQWPEGSFQ